MSCADKLIDSLEGAHPWGRWWSTLAACRLSSDSLGVAEKLGEKDAATRAAVAKFATLADEETGGYQTLLQQLRGDRDLRVRIAADYAGPLDETVTVWTCSWCNHENIISDQDCRRCSNGTRPTVKSLAQV